MLVKTKGESKLHIVLEVIHRVILEVAMIVLLLFNVVTIVLAEWNNLWRLRNILL